MQIVSLASGATGGDAVTLVHGPVNGPMRLHASAISYAPRDARVAYLTIPGDVSHEQIERLRRDWERAHSGLAFVPRVVVLTGGATIAFDNAVNVHDTDVATGEGGSKVASEARRQPAPPQIFASTGSGFSSVGVRSSSLGESSGAVRVNRTGACQGG